MASNSESRYLAPLVATLLLFVVLIAFGLVRHWNLALPVVGAARFARWLVRGVVSAVPVFALGGLVLRGRAKGAPAALAAALHWAAGSVVVMLLGIAMLAAGRYTPLVWQLLATAIWLGLVGWLAARRWRPLAGIWRTVTHRGHSAPSLCSWSALLILLALLAAAHASLPPDTRDELAYHLVLPQMWAHQGDWWLPADNPHMMFPANTEILWAWAGSVSGPLAPRFTTLVFALLTIAVLGEWMVGDGRSRWVRSLSLVVLLVTPVALTSAAICYVEWPLLFFLFLGWRLTREDAILGGRLAATCTGVAWAAAVGMKYSAALFVLVLAVEWVVGPARRRSRIAAAVLSLVAAGLLLAAPWWIRNWIATGDPWFPLAGAFAGGASGTAAAALTGYVELSGFWRWLPWLYHGTIDVVSDHRLHPLWPVLHIAVIAAGWRRRRDLPWLSVVVATAVLAPFTPAPRVTLPLVLLVWLFVPGMLAGLESHRASRATAVAIVALTAVVSLPLAAHYLFISGGTAIPEYLLGISGRDRFLEQRGLLTPAVRWVRTSTPEDARVWAWCEDRTLYFDRWVRADSPYGRPAFLRAVERGGVSALTEEAAAVDYVVLNRERCSEGWDLVDLERSRTPIDPARSAELTRWAVRFLREEARDQRYVVYEVAVNR